MQAEARLKNSTAGGALKETIAKKAFRTRSRAQGLEKLKEGGLGLCFSGWFTMDRGTLACAIEEGVAQVGALEGPEVAVVVDQAHNAVVVEGADEGVVAGGTGRRA